MAGGRRFLAAVASAALLAPANLALVPRGLRLAPSTRRRKIQNQNQAAYRAASSDADRPSSHGRLALLKRIIKRGDIRGADRYGSTNNSTILAPADAGEIEVICSWCSSVPLFITEVSIRYLDVVQHAAFKVGVKPTLEASKETWQRAWRLHRFMMKHLHKFDSAQPTDSKLALACLWWKAIAGNDRRSPVYDYRLSYDLLPAGMCCN